jgi:hypothetical protein
MSTKNLVDITGQRFGELVATALTSQRTKIGEAIWLCTCDCGQTCLVRGAILRNGRRQRCGRSRHRLPRSGVARNRNVSPTYRSWCSMISRCKPENTKQHPYHAGRGICVCERWTNFQNFLADMGPRPSLRYSIDRIDNDGNYEPSNCRWATRKQQARNARFNHVIEFRGESRCIAEWCEILGISRGTIRQRLEKGWSMERTLGEPVAARFRNKLYKGSVQR